MAYEIPQELQYKEKIIFNLTFSQLGYAFLFIAIIVLIAKSNLGLNVKLTIAVFPAVLGILFIFFNFSSNLRNFFYWIRFRKATTMSIKMVKYLGLKDIKDNLVEIRKYRFNLLSKFRKKDAITEKLAILEISPINFSIKTEREKESLIMGFQKFLNSLD